MTLDANDKKGWANFHRELLETVERAGLTKAATAEYVWRAAWITVVYALAWGGLLTDPPWPQRMVLIIGSAFVGLQAGFMSHDVSHRNLRGGRRTTRWLGRYFMSFLAGQAWPHWEWQHGSHHRHTQDVAHDPDIDVDMFALNDASARRKTGWQRWTTMRQGWLLWPLITLQAFSIRGNSWIWLFKQGRRVRFDTFLYSSHYILWLVVPMFFIGPWATLLNYALHSWFFGPYLAVSFIWNHVGAEAFEASPDRAYAAQRVLGSRNLSGSPVYTLFFGALNFHVEHHLAPHVPTSRLRHVRPLLDAQLKRHGLEIPAMGFTAAMRDVGKYVWEVAERLKQLEPPPASPTRSDPRVAEVAS